ncbi:MAG: ABC transporter ATP-binding protein [Synergistaceae bacterium]|jgi:peptide/nickel transport system ATP-binding protein|nr:ABC transporter ATP-binding protein [Synergistaceae bacterium]
MAGSVNDEHTPVLDVRNLESVYHTDDGTVYAVNGISFTIEEKETIGLVGETGAGKTTTALSILRLLPERTGRVVGGQILYRGDDLLKKDADEMRMIRGACVSMIFQDPMTALNPTISAGDQILESLEIHNADGRPREALDARVDELLSLVGISPGRKHEYPHQFSGGMKQRIVIAIALACEPLLLIADEPTTALDVTIQAQVLVLMEELKEKLGTSMIMITHDLGVVAKTCDKVAVMYAGEIVEYGDAAVIFDQKRPHHPYTVGLFRAIPNMRDSSRRLRPIEGLMPDPANLPSGCKFHPRCWNVTDECRVNRPAVRDTDGHRIFCGRALDGDAG